MSVEVEVEVRRDPDVVALLEPLWEALRQHHARLEDVPPVQDAATSWAVERSAYLEHLRHPDAFVVTAADPAGEMVGYALVKIRTGPDEMWRTGDRIAEVETLSVSPASRGHGVGSLLMDRVMVELAARGIADVQLGVMVANEPAIRFYARHGLVPRFLVLSTFGRPAAVQGETGVADG